MNNLKLKMGYMFGDDEVFLLEPSSDAEYTKLVAEYHKTAECEMKDLLKQTQPDAKNRSSILPFLTALQSLQEEKMEMVKIKAEETAEVILQLQDGSLNHMVRKINRLKERIQRIEREAESKGGEADYVQEHK